MVGVAQPGCLDFGVYAMRSGATVEESMKHTSHFDKCDAANIYTDSFRKCFWSTTHCKCECHYMNMTAEQKRARERAYNWWLARTFSLALLPYALIPFLA